MFQGMNSMYPEGRFDSGSNKLSTLAVSCLTQLEPATAVLYLMWRNPDVTAKPCGGKGPLPEKRGVAVAGGAKRPSSGLVVHVERRDMHVNVLFAFLIRERLTTAHGVRMMRFHSSKPEDRSSNYIHVCMYVWSKILWISVVEHNCTVEEVSGEYRGAIFCVTVAIQP